MAYTRNDGNKNIVFEAVMHGGDLNEIPYFHFNDLEELRRRHPDATGFTVYKGSVDAKPCSILVLTKGKSKTGASLPYMAQQDLENEIEGDYVAFSCPRIIDTDSDNQPTDYEDLPSFGKDE